MSGPTGKELADRFEHPDPRKYGPVPIWWWSGATLTRDRLRWQMEQLLSQGVAQAVILNLAPTGPLYGSLADDPPFMSEPWWEIFLGACADADELGFSFWPYDQIGFSGANLQGKLATKHPEWSGRAIGRLVAPADLGAELAVPLGAEPIGAYCTHPDGTASAVDIVEGVARIDPTEGLLNLVYSEAKGFDYFNPEATAGLIDTVHGEFARRAGDWFGSVIIGFFQDELPAMPTWSDAFASSFSEFHGYEIGPVAGALWGDPIPASAVAPSAHLVRLNYQEHRARMAQKATFGPLERWFEDHGLICGFDQQSPAREGDPVGTTRLYGDYLALHSTYGAPGSDHWGDSKVHSSLAHAGAKPRTWLEAFHSSGWGGTIEETYDWLAPFLRRGTTLYSPHAVYYSTVGGWWEWAPPSTCWRQPYWSEYHILSGAVSRLSELLVTGHHRADTVLVFPTSTMQAGVTMAGTMPEAENARRVYHELNGNPAWYAEVPGVLDAARFDYDIFDEATIAKASVEGGRLRVGKESYSNVVLPGAAALPTDAARVLADLAESGGTVVVVGSPPDALVGLADGTGFFAAVANGSIRVVKDAHAVPSQLERGTIWVDTDAPHLLRQVGETWVVVLFAHDQHSGTVQPIVTGGGSGIEWIETTWDAYWSEITANGYRFVPVTDRVAKVALHGVADVSVQQWDPRTGDRYSLDHERVDGTTQLTVGFEHGTVTVLVFGADLPAATATAPGALVAEQEVSGWRLEASSLLDNNHGDFADRRRTGVLPVEVWQFEHWTDGSPTDRRQVTATFGPFGDVVGPFASASPEPWAKGPAEWRPASWSLSRGIEQDPVHGDSLGPKGYVPEEFLRWGEVGAGEWVAARTWIHVPPSPETLWLAIAANAEKHVLVDGSTVEVDGDGYLSTASIPPGDHRIEFWLRAERDESIRASFAVVSNRARFRRPEWMEPVSHSTGPTRWEAELAFELSALPDDPRILVGSEQPCTVIVNGQEVGRQSDFDPYAERRFGRLHSYDLADVLSVGANRIRLASSEGSRRPAILVDSISAARGGLGVQTGMGELASWRDGVAIAARRRSLQWQDPRFVSIEARPHPLPRANWLEESASDGVTVVDIVPDRDPASRDVQHLSFALPLGTTALTVPTEVDFEAAAGEQALVVDGNRIVLAAPSAPGDRLTLSFRARDGRRAGALLEGAVNVLTEATEGPLVDWAELGLSSLAGQVVYRATVDRPELASGERLFLDLGRVRGSVSVAIDGAPVGALAWSPYRIDITQTAGGAPGPMQIEITVKNTLAGYLQHASPTPGVFEGQVRAGLLGPVRLRRHAGPNAGPAPDSR